MSAMNCIKYELGEKRDNLFGKNASFNSANSDVNSASPDANSASSDANSASSDANNASSIKKRMKKEELHDLIKDVCQDWVSLVEIVAKVGKSNSYLRNIVIPRMLSDKILEMLYPGIPKHPCQKYKLKA